jgi:Zn-finger nucleic acid-binding protein
MAVCAVQALLIALLQVEQDACQGLTGNWLIEGGLMTILAALLTQECCHQHTTDNFADNFDT